MNPAETVLDGRADKSDHPMTSGTSEPMDPGTIETIKETTVMKAFCIDKDNSITVLAAINQAPEGTDVFTSVRELTLLTADWPLGRLVDVWNSFAGAAPFGDLKPVRKFENRAKGCRRIWDAIQKLDLPGAKADVAKAGKPAKAGAQARTKAAKPAKAAATAKSPKTTRVKKESSNGAGGGKKAEVIAMMGKDGGATLAAIMKATDWQAHTVRGFVAGTLGKKMGITVKSFKNDKGERTYQITEAAAKKALA